MSNGITPLGTATGAGWQHCIERDGNFSPWADWSPTLVLTSDPNNGELQTGVSYYLRARILSFPAGSPGSKDSPFSSQFVLSNSGRPVYVGVDGPAYAEAISEDTSSFTNSCNPVGDCTGPSWQYRLGRGNVLTDWQNWTNGFAFTKDPTGGELQTGVVYDFYARSLSIASGQPGSIQIPLVASFELLSRSEAVSATSDPSLVISSKANDPLSGLSVSDKNALFAGLLNAMNPTVKAALCAVVSSCPIDDEPTDTEGDDDDTPIVVIHNPTFDNYVFFLPIPQPIGTGSTPTTDPKPVGSIEFNNCDRIGGWVADVNYPNQPQIARIECDGIIVGRTTAQSPRPTDVVAELIRQGATNVNTTTPYGYEFVKPTKYNDGQPHTWRVFVGDSQAECFNNVANTITCAAPIDNTPYPIQLKTSVGAVLHKSGDALTGTLIERMSSPEGSERVYASGGIPQWAVSGNPAGIVLTPASDGKTVQIQATSAAATGNITLNASVNGGTAIPSTIQVVSDDCQRPTGLTIYQLNWKFIPQGGYGRQFSTLDDAILSAGKKYDNTTPGSLGPPDIVQAANLNVGTTVYNGTGTDCGKYGSTIAYVTDSSGGNTILKAVLVVNGIIQDVKDSDYVTPSQAPTIQGVAIWRTTNDVLIFLYKAAQPGDQQLEDFWVPGQYGATDYVHSPYNVNAAAYNPDGYKDYYYFDSYGYWSQDYANFLLTNSAFKVRKQGTTTNILSITFKAPNLAKGEIRQIYPAQ